ncbi:MAG: hypothetical protein ABIQ09_17070 [Jatrophihabitantaceae bacterium]
MTPEASTSKNGVSAREIERKLMRQVAGRRLMYKPLVAECTSGAICQSAVSSQQSKLRIGCA